VIHVCLSAFEALCVKMRYTNRRVLYFTLHVWMIFQRQVEKMLNMSMQLDSAAANADAITRGRCRAEHRKLTDRELVIQQKAPERQQVVARHIDSWRRYNEQLRNACAVLDKLESKLPECVDITSDVSLLRQQLTDCEDARDKLQSKMSHANDVVELGQLLLQHVNSPHVRSQVDSLSDRIHSLPQKIDSDIQQYLFILLT